MDRLDVDAVKTLVNFNGNIRVSASLWGRERKLEPVGEA